MALRFVPIALALMQAVTSLPVTLQDLEVADDTMAVGSYIRGVRAAAVSTKSFYLLKTENTGDTKKTSKANIQSSFSRLNCSLL